MEWKNVRAWQKVIILSLDDGWSSTAHIFSLVCDSYLVSLLRFFVDPFIVKYSYWWNCRDCILVWANELLSVIYKRRERSSEILPSFHCITPISRETCANIISILSWRSPLLGNKIDYSIMLFSDKRKESYP